MRASDRIRQLLIGHLLDAAHTLDTVHGDETTATELAGKALRSCAPMDRALADRAQSRIELTEPAPC